MELPVLSIAALPHITPPEGAKTAILMIMRWFHIIAGVLWIGLLYFFNLVNVPFQKELDASTKTKVVPNLMPKALWWFRWSSVATVFLGFGYWTNLVAAEHRANGTSSGRIMGSFFLVWTVAFVIEMGVLMMGKLNGNGLAVGLVFALIIIAGAWTFLEINSDVQTNPVLAIGIGGGMGWFMMLNVWGIIWRFQKKLIRWTAESAGGKPVPAESAKLARIAFLASRANFWVSFPMLFFMNASQHYQMFGK